MMDKALQDVKLELFESQDKIIRLQSGAIIGLVSLLVQHKDVDDADFAPIKEKIDEAAALRAEYGL